MRKESKNKECVIQIRCTKKEKEKLDYCASKENMDRSKFVRKILFEKKDCNIDIIWMVVMVQQILNDIKKDWGGLTRDIDKRVDKLWKKLL